MKRFGLIGKSLGHSFSKKYFSEKFASENLPDHHYENFEIASIAKIQKVLKTPKLKGLNVTIPYKRAVMDYLDEIDPVALQIGAVNTIAFRDGKSVGFNTDYLGFQESLAPHLTSQHNRALILGTGGASAAIAYALKNLGIDFHYVSRKAEKDHHWTYSRAATELQNFTILINTTPLGTHPNTDAMPPLKLFELGPHHLVYDLIYNPPETKLLRLAREKGAQTVNGRRMLEIQAEKSWQLWNEL